MEALAEMISSGRLPVFIWSDFEMGVASTENGAFFVRAIQTICE